MASRYYWERGLPNGAATAGFSSDAATQIFAAKPKTGMGKCALAFTTELMIPQGAPGDTYTGQFTITLTPAVLSR